MGRKTCRKGFHGWGHHRDTAGVGWGHRLGVGEGANSLPVGYIRMAPCCPQKVTSELLLKVSGAVRGERRRRRVYPKQRRYVQGNRVSTHMFGEQPGEVCGWKEVKWGRRVETVTNGEVEPVGPCGYCDDLGFCSK